MEKNKIHALVIYALFVAVIFVLTFTPIGYINVGIIEITLIHIPVILASFFLGLKGSIIMGFFFGLSSLLRGLLMPTPMAAAMLGGANGFGLYNLLMVVAILFLPRILVGVVAHVMYNLITPKNNMLGMAVAGVCGSLTNTVLFLGLLYLMAGPILADMFGTTVGGVATLLFSTVGLLNGTLEAIAAAVICTAVGKALQAYLKRRTA